MTNVPFVSWLNAKFKKNGKYVDNRFGDLCKNLSSVVKSNPFEEDFEYYDNLEDWLEHLEMHVAPESAITTMVDAWSMFQSEGLDAEVDFIKGEEDESN